MSLRCNASPQDKIQSQIKHSQNASSLWAQSQKRRNSGDNSPRTLYNHTLQQSLRSPAPAYAKYSRPSLVSTDSSTNVSFQNAEHGGHYSQLQVTFPDSVTCPPFVRPIPLMQVIWKSQSFPMSLKLTGEEFGSSGR